MFKLYRLKNYNFRLIIWLLMISGIGVLLVGSAKASLQSRQLIGVILGLVVNGCSFFDGLQLAVEFLLDHLRGKHYNAADRSVLRGFCRWCYPMAGSWLCTFSADRAFEDLADHSIFCPVSDGSRRYPEYL